MESPSLPHSLSKQPKILAATRRVAWLQVYLPLGLVILLAASVAALFWTGGWVEAGSLADAALVLLVIPAILIGVIFLALLVAVIVLIIEVRRRLPEPADQAQMVLRQVSRATRQGADASVKPLLALNGAAAVLRALRSIFRMR